MSRNLIVIPIPNVDGDRDSAFFRIGFGHFSGHQLKVDNFQSFEIEQTRIFDSDDEARLVDSLFRRHLYKINRNGFHKMLKKNYFCDVFNDDDSSSV